MSDKLLPCPFCGGRATIQQDTRYPRYGKKDTVKAYEPICISSGCLIYKADSVYFLSEQEAISAWNNRTQPNEPLTLEQLREMDGKPVWVETGEVSIGEQIIGRWHILHSTSDLCVNFMGGGNGYALSQYGKTWLAYRNKPEQDVEK